jgi:hypothetical protein
MSPGDKYLVVLDGVNHMFYNNPEALPKAFRSVQSGSPDDEPIVKGISTVFWLSYLLGNAKVRADLTELPAIRRLASPGLYETR